VESWSIDRVMALAPDPASASAGQALASAKKWTLLARGDRAIWGLCQGSGKTPYQVRVDLSEPAFKCGCPSRKFPCKHGIALLLMFAKRADDFASADEPGWVADWMTERGTRASKRAEQAARPADKPVDPEAQAKRAAQRAARVRDGVAGCRVWLEDLVRRGLAAAQADATADWERAAARLVDAGAGGLASFVRRIPALMASGSGWELRTVDALGRLHLLLCAAERLDTDTLPPDLATDVRTALGWTQSREEALGGEAVADRWIAAGQVIEEDERFRVVRTWLVGQRTGRRALLLDFAAGDRPLDRTIVGGIAFDGELAFYPSRLPLRAVLKSRAESFDARAIIAAIGDTSNASNTRNTIADVTIEAGLAHYAGALAANPWIFRWPLVISGVRPVREDERWFLVDRDNHGLPVRNSFAGSLDMWRLVSARGAAPMTTVVEWDGITALPIGAFAESPGEFVDLAPGWAA
jgi:hypothetical protein